jgi:paraquat-inducible protein A
MAEARPLERALTAREAGLVGCRLCGRVSSAEAATCPRCGSRLASRAPHSLQRVWAWLTVGLMAYVPANLYPIMVTGFLGSDTESTIVGGVVELAHHGAWGLALIVGVASIGIPVAKFVAIAYLAWSIERRVEMPVHRRVHLYEAVEFIGRWSMIDVFVVAILAATVQLGFLARVEPGPAAVFFALSVVATMLSAQAFDPRLLWDRAPAGVAGHR